MSGYNLSEFFFGGFLPSKNSSKVACLSKSKTNQIASLFFETPHRIIHTLELLVNEFDNPTIFIGKEMTKLHENYLKDKTSIVLDWFKEDPKRTMGEFVIMIFWKKENINPHNLLINKLNSLISSKDLIDISTRYLNTPKNSVYEIIKSNKKD
jgi:16S rRNA (cytidine1402-2'-O)-methyltransferase